MHSTDSTLSAVWRDWTIPGVRTSLNSPQLDLGIYTLCPQGRPAFCDGFLMMTTLLIDVEYEEKNYIYISAPTGPSSAVSR